MPGNRPRQQFVARGAPVHVPGDVERGEGGWRRLVHELREEVDEVDLLLRAPGLPVPDLLRIQVPVQDLVRPGIDHQGERDPPFPQVVCEALQVLRRTREPPLAVVGIHLVVESPERAEEACRLEQRRRVARALAPVPHHPGEQHRVLLQETAGRLPDVPGRQPRQRVDALCGIADAAVVVDHVAGRPPAVVHRLVLDVGDVEDDHHRVHVQLLVLQQVAQLPEVDGGGVGRDAGVQRLDAGQEFAGAGDEVVLRTDADALGEGVAEKQDAAPVALRRHGSGRHGHEAERIGPHRVAHAAPLAHHVQVRLEVVVVGRCIAVEHRPGGDGHGIGIRRRRHAPRNTAGEQVEAEGHGGQEEHEEHAGMGTHLA